MVGKKVLPRLLYDQEVCIGDRILITDQNDGARTPCYFTDMPGEWRRNSRNWHFCEVDR